MALGPRLKHPATRWLLAVLGACAYAAALPPLGWWPLAWIALAPLCLACAGKRPLRAAGYGLVFGSIAAALSSPWFPMMIGNYFGAGSLLKWPLAMAGWVLGGAIYCAAFGAWIGWATLRGRLSPLLVGAAWWWFEWLRANAPIPNPWALFGYSQIGWLPAAQIADLLGVFGIGAWLSMLGAMLAGIWEPVFRGRSPRATTAAVVSMTILVLGYGSLRLSSPVSELGPDSILVGLVQGAVAPDRRYAREHLAENLQVHLRLTRQAAARGVDLVAWPELAIDFYLGREPRLEAGLVSTLAALEVDLIAGGLGVRHLADGPRPTNSVYWIDGQGVQDRYDKVRLMTFSESNPLPFGSLGSDRLVAGTGPRPIRLRDIPFGLIVCSEAMHADYVRETVRAGAEVLVAPTVDSWFGTHGGSRQQLGAAAMRAIETRRFVLRPTASGVTAVIDPVGRVVGEAPTDEPALLIGSVEPREAQTPYVRMGDVGPWLAVGWLMLDARRRTRRSSYATSAPGASNA